MRHTLLILATLALASPALAGGHHNNHGSPKGGDVFGVTDPVKADQAAVRAQHIVDTELAAGRQPTNSQINSVQQSARWAQLLHDHCGC